MPRLYDTTQVGGLMPRWRDYLPLLRLSLLLWTLIIGSCLLLGCSDATGPSVPDDLGPQYMKTYQGHGEGGGGGGGASGGRALCEIPHHLSGDCIPTGMGLLGGTGGWLAGCVGAAATRNGGQIAQCGLGAGGVAMGWTAWYNQPDAHGVAHEPEWEYPATCAGCPGDQYFAPTYPIGGPSW